MLTKSCELCSTQFSSRREDAKFCSRICGCRNSAIVRSERARKRQNKCTVCKSSFYVLPHRSDSAKYCSNKCRHAGKSLQMIGKRSPQLTSEVIARTNTKYKLGSKNEKNRGPRLKISGDRHWNWRGGIAGIKKAERQMFMETYEYKAWRSAVFHRDNYTCQVCDVSGVPIHADHIKQYSKYPELRTELTNGRTLCVPCHYYVTFKRKMKIGAVWCGYKMEAK